MYIMVNWNLNPFDHKVNANLKANIQTIFFNYKLIILKPTRISKTNATVIDHINTSNFLETDEKQSIKTMI